MIPDHKNVIYNLNEIEIDLYFFFLLLPSRLPSRSRSITFVSGIELKAIPCIPAGDNIARVKYVIIMRLRKFMALPESHVLSDELTAATRLRGSIVSSCCALTDHTRSFRSACHTRRSLSVRNRIHLTSN